MTSCFIGCFCSAYQRSNDASLALPHGNAFLTEHVYEHISAAH